MLISFSARLHNHIIFTVFQDGVSRWSIVFFLAASGRNAAIRGDRSRHDVRARRPRHQRPAIPCQHVAGNLSRWAVLTSRSCHEHRMVGNACCCYRERLPGISREEATAPTTRYDSESALPALGEDRRPSSRSLRCKFPVSLIIYIYYLCMYLCIKYPDSIFFKIKLLH